MTMKLLVADDSITIQTVVSLTFADEDAEIETVSSGDQVLAKVRSMKPDIVLADIFMPGLNGYQVCECIKTDPDLCELPVVLMVGTFETFDRDEAERVKFDACLTKPFDSNELVQTVKSLISGARKSLMQGTFMDETQKGGQSSETVPRGAVTLEALASERTRESFLGPNPILDVLGLLKVTGSTGASVKQTQHAALPQEILRAIVEGVVRQLSPDIVREVAWEVVPELSEMLIRQRLSESTPDSAAVPPAHP